MQLVNIQNVTVWHKKISQTLRQQNLAGLLELHKTNQKELEKLTPKGRNLEL